MMLFITTEVMFFVGFFWAYFNFSLFPEHVLGTATPAWPPVGVQTFNPVRPAAAQYTLILLLSGTTVTWAHHSLIEGDRKHLVMALGFTILLGMSFSTFQALEYGEAPFKFFGGGIYSSVFLSRDRVPRVPRHHRHRVPDRVLVPRPQQRVHPATPFRLRSSSLVLAFRRRRVAVPVRVHLPRRPSQTSSASSRSTRRAGSSGRR